MIDQLGDVIVFILAVVCFLLVFGDIMVLLSYYIYLSVYMFFIYLSKLLKLGILWDIESHIIDIYCSYLQCVWWTLFISPFPFVVYFFTPNNFLFFCLSCDMLSISEPLNHII